MENTITIKEIELAGVKYQFKFESTTRKVEVLIRKTRKKNWYSDKRIEYWEPLAIPNELLYREIFKFQVIHTNRELKIQFTGNQDMLNHINAIESLQ